MMISIQWVELPFAALGVFALGAIIYDSFFPFGR
jgi:hypothetical protein